MQITIWSKPACPACDRAKMLCDLNDLTYEEKLLGVTGTREELLAAVPDARSVPQVFVGGKHLGGLPQFIEFLDNRDVSTTTE